MVGFSSVSFITVWRVTSSIRFGSRAKDLQIKTGVTDSQTQDCRKLSVTKRALKRIVSRDRGHAGDRYSVDSRVERVASAVVDRRRILKFSGVEMEDRAIDSRRDVR